eukprot:4608938-Amphidinium_carterae.1
MLRGVSFRGFLSLNVPPSAQQQSRQAHVLLWGGLFIIASLASSVRTQVCVASLWGEFRELAKRLCINDGAAITCVMS